MIFDPFYVSKLTVPQLEYLISTIDVQEPNRSVTYGMYCSALVHGLFAGPFGVCQYSKFEDGLREQQLHILFATRGEARVCQGRRIPEWRIRRVRVR